MTPAISVLNTHLHQASSLEKEIYPDLIFSHSTIGILQNQIAWIEVERIFAYVLLFCASVGAMVLIWSFDPSLSILVCAFTAIIQLTLMAEEMVSTYFTTRRSKVNVELGQRTKIMAHIEQLASQSEGDLRGILQNELQLTTEEIADLLQMQSNGENPRPILKTLAGETYEANRYLPLISLIANYRMLIEMQQMFTGRMSEIEAQMAESQIQSKLIDLRNQKIDCDFAIEESKLHAAFLRMVIKHMNCPDTIDHYFQFVRDSDPFNDFLAQRDTLIIRDSDTPNAPTIGTWSLRDLQAMSIADMERDFFPQDPQEAIESAV